MEQSEHGKNKALRLAGRNNGLNTDKEIVLPRAGPEIIINGSDTETGMRNGKIGGEGNADIRTLLECLS